jgi:hypothetical protein
MIVRKISQMTGGRPYASAKGALKTVQSCRHTNHIPITSSALPTKHTMMKILSTRIKILAGLVIFSTKVSFDLILHKTTSSDQHQPWLRVADENTLAQAFATESSSRLLQTTGSNLRVKESSQLSSTQSVVATSLPLLNATTDTLALVPETNLSNNVSTNETSRESTTSDFDPTKYAYAYVIGGCNPDNGHYKGFLYNILVSARILREEGAKADVVAMFQISSKSNATVLPDEDIRQLTSLGVKVVYIPKSEIESFYDTVMNKFRILALTQYRRVLLMDGDVMPIGNLDFLFELSDGKNATLKENLIVMGTMEPANAGFFMLTPGEGEYERLTDIVHTREKEATKLKGRKFDEIKGWGHVIDANDEWESRRGKGGTKWNFHFAFSDQGLLFHWTKYVKRTVSIVHGYAGIDQQVQNWSPTIDGKVVLEERLKDPFNGRSKPRFKLYKHCNKFMCDFIHFTGKGKPWMHMPPANIAATEYKKDDPTLVWWHTLYGLNEELGMALNFTTWAPQEPPLGLVATFRDLDRRISSGRKK